MKRAFSTVNTAMASTMKCVIADAGLCSIVERPIPSPVAGQVLVKIHMTALNRADTLQRVGKYPVPAGESDVMGLECVGEVISPGAKFQEGQRVMSLLSAGGYGEFVAVDERLLMPIPAEMSYAEAACIPETWLTGALERCNVTLRPPPTRSFVGLTRHFGT